MPEAKAAPLVSARDLALIAVFVGVTAALGLIPPVPVGPVPITAQSMGMVLCGAVLGPKRGGLSMALFMLLVGVGLPLLAGGRGGIGVLLGPSVGFFIGWIVLAGLIGFLTYRVGRPYRVWVGIVINIACSLLLYVFGIAGMMAITKMTLSAAVVANLPFLPGDAIKAVLGALIAAGVHKAVPDLIGAKIDRN